MKLTGKFVFVDNDPDDIFILRRAAIELGYSNDIVEFYTAPKALEYLETTTDSVAFVVCDIKMPMMDGIELKKEIEARPALKLKSIPFIYLTDGIDPYEVMKAYELNVQGYFLKTNSLPETQAILQSIVQYWEKCVHPRMLVA